MTNEQWKEVEHISDPLQAEILRGLLEAQGIQVWLAQEGAARALGLHLTPMGEVILMIPASQVSHASDILGQFFDGTLEKEFTDMEYPTILED